MIPRTTPQWAMQIPPSSPCLFSSSASSHGKQNQNTNMKLSGMKSKRIGPYVLFVREQVKNMKDYIAKKEAPVLQQKWKALSAEEKKRYFDLCNQIREQRKQALENLSPEEKQQYTELKMKPKAKKLLKKLKKNLPKKPCLPHLQYYKDVAKGSGGLQKGLIQRHNHQALIRFKALDYQTQRIYFNMHAKEKIIYHEKKKEFVINIVKNHAELYEYFFPKYLNFLEQILVDMGRPHSRSKSIFQLYMTEEHDKEKCIWENKKQLMGQDNYDFVVKAEAILTHWPNMPPNSSKKSQKSKNKY